MAAKVMINSKELRRIMLTGHLTLERMSKITGISISALSRLVDADCYVQIKTAAKLHDAFGECVLFERSYSAGLAAGYKIKSIKQVPSDFIYNGEIGSLFLLEPNTESHSKGEIQK